MSRYEIVVVAAGLGLALLQLALCRSLVRAGRRACVLDERVTRLGDALSLLTETAESGFRSVACEVERLSSRPRRSSSRPAATIRVAKAARRGRTLQEIAALEQVSEGEVHLRLRLADHRQGPTAAAAPKPQRPGGVRRPVASVTENADRPVPDWLLASPLAETQSADQVPSSGRPEDLLAATPPSSPRPPGSRSHGPLRP